MIDNKTEPCILASNLSQLDTTMITALLEDSGIPSFIKDHGSGGYMKVYMGYTIFGQDIYVGQNDYEKAKSILDFYLCSSQNSEAEDISQMMDEDGTNESNDEQIKIPPSKKSTVARTIILINALVLLAILVYQWLF